MKNSGQRKLSAAKFRFKSRCGMYAGMQKFFFFNLFYIQKVSFVRNVSYNSIVHQCSTSSETSFLIVNIYSCLSFQKINLCGFTDNDAGIYYVCSQVTAHIIPIHQIIKQLLWVFVFFSVIDVFFIHETSNIS